MASKSSCIAFFPASVSPSTCLPVLPCLPGFTLEHVQARRIVTVGIAPLRFLAAYASCVRLPVALFIYLSSLGSSRLSTGIPATMAPAEYTGKVRALSPRAAGLYPPRFFDSLRAPHVLACAPLVSGLTVCSCPYGRSFAFGFFQLPLTGSPLPFGCGCRLRPRQTPCILIARAHAGHTEGEWPFTCSVLYKKLHSFRHGGLPRMSFM